MAGAPLPPELVGPMAARLVRALPPTATGLSLRSWRSPDGRLLVLAWSNEDADDEGVGIGVPVRAQPPVLDAHAPGWAAAPDRVRVVAGYLSRPPDPALAGGDELDRALDDSTGVYAVVQATSNGEIDAWNTLPRLEGLFWQQAERFAVSNRPLLAHLAATGAEEPSYEIGALPAFLNTGFHASERTPFEGVNVLPPASRLRVRDDRVTVVRRAPRRASTTLDMTSKVDEVADALLAAGRSLRSVRYPLTLALTGGRDSRLVAATLAAAGVPFRAFTRGRPDHPDVVVAAKVAQRLGIQHTVTDVTPESTKVDLEDRARVVLRAVDGLLSPFDNIPRPSAFRREAVVNGIGGESLRGGYHRSGRASDREQARTFLERQWLASAAMLTADAARAFRAEVHALAEPQPGENELEVLDRVYLHYRAGRWSAASRLAGTANTLLYEPLFDDEVTWLSRRVPIEDRIREHLLFRLLQRLGPEVVDLPLVGPRWMFERDGPVEEIPGWDARTPLTVARSARANVDWRLTKGGPLDDAFRRRLLDDTRGALFDIVDRSGLERALASRSGGRVVVRTVPEAQFLWAAHASAVLLSGDWLEPVARLRPVEVRTRTTLTERALMRAQGVSMVPRRLARAGRAWLKRAIDAIAPGR